MGVVYKDGDFDWLYPARPLDLLRHRDSIDRLCKTTVPIPDSQFRPEWLEKPDEFLIVLQDDRLAGVVHLEEKRKSALAHIVVSPSFHRTNLSYLLGLRALDKVFNEWQKGKLFADIGSSNRPAKMLVASLGFNRVAVYNKRIKYRLTFKEYCQGVGQGIPIRPKKRKAV